MVHLLRRDVIGLCPHVDLLIDVHTGYDEEDAWSAGAAGEQAAQAEDDGALVLLQEGPGHRALTCTTFTDRHREKGRVMKMSSTDMTTMA